MSFDVKLITGIGWWNICAYCDRLRSSQLSSGILLNTKDLVTSCLYSDMNMWLQLMVAIVGYCLDSLKYYSPFLSIVPVMFVRL